MKDFFGTDGIRAQFGKEPLSPETLIKIGKALGSWTCSKTNKPKIIIGYDTRISSQLSQAALTTGLLHYPVELIHSHVIPTPVLFHLVQKHYYNCGIMITASHNQAQDNGIKLFTPIGKFDESAQTELMHHYETPQAFDWNNLGKETILPNVTDWYLKLIAPFFKELFLTNTTVVLDCANGATAELAPLIFKQFGATVITLNNNPDGHNINKDCGSLHPEQLQKTVLEQKADFGFAFDGDGDRVVAVTQEGQVKDGDDILALLAQHPAYQNQSAFVGTLMTNQGLETFLQQQGKTLVRTPVGDKYVATALQEHGLLAGAEPSGHVILQDFSTTSDGIFTALKLTQMALLTDNKTLSSFQKFPQKMINVTVGDKKDLTQEPFCSLIKSYQTNLKQGRLLVRYSGTEPVLRIMVEAPEEVQAETICASLSEQLARVLN